MGLKKQIKEIYEEEAKIYDLTRAFFEAGYFSRRERNCLSASLKEGYIVLGLGCGTGRHHNFLVSIGCEVVGVDLSVEMLKRARKKEKKAHLIAADVEKLPFKEEVFDAIYCSRAFKLFPNKLHVLKQAYRSLKRNGLILITEGVTDLIWVRLALKMNLLGQDSYLYPSKKLADLFKEAGFKDIRQKCVILLPNIVYSHVPKLILKIINIIEDKLTRGRYIMMIGEK